MLIDSTGLGEIGVEQPHPRFIKGIKEHHVVRVAAGAGHSLALTTSGQVWSFGQGSFGTLGTSPGWLCDRIMKPFICQNC